MNGTKTKSKRNAIPDCIPFMVVRFDYKDRRQSDLLKAPVISEITKNTRNM